MYQRVTGGGSFTAKNIAAINANFDAAIVPDLWVRPQDGDDNSADGTYAAAYATVEAALNAAQEGQVVGILGVVQEEIATPLGLNDVSLVGMANQPRQATTSGVPNGGGATWLSPSGGTAALLQIRGQGWKVQNIYFNNSATDAPDIDLLLEGDPPTAADAGHAQILDCVLTGEDDGIWLTGGVSFITIKRCRFFNFKGAGDTAIKGVSGLGIGTNWSYLLEENVFHDNVNHIVAALHNGHLVGNVIDVKGLTVATTTVAVDFTNGAANTVMGNYLGDNATGAAATWTAGTNDKWCNFTADDGVSSAVPS